MDDRKNGPWKDDLLLPHKEAKWIMDMEGNETSLLQYVPASGGNDESFPNGQFYFKRGHFVTLAEVFKFGCRHCTCYDLYRTYVHLPVFIHRRGHSVSHSAEGTHRRNAKLLRHELTGHYGLPEEKRPR